MISLTINDQTIPAEEGQTVMQAALAAGIYIPSLCYHPAIASSGACRLCVVEIEGQRGVVSSCTMAAAEGMIVRTETPEIQQQRKSILWLMQSEHPVEVIPGTQFAKVLAHVGVAEFPAGHGNHERPLAIVAGDPLYVRDPQRCILCERCVRICKQTRGVGSLGLIGRGIRTTVSTPQDESLVAADCRFCGACVEVCPTGALRDKAEFAAEEKTEALLPCSNTCPAGINISRYVRYISEGRFQDAVEVIRQKAPLPLTLGCVCDHPCEAVCRRADVDEPVAIRLLKRYAAQSDDFRWKEKLQVASDTGKRVAIVGAGPAGLTAAWFLRLQGHAVTIFESKDKPGGMLRYGIPRYRLPADVLDREIADILSIGIELKCGEAVESVDALKAAGFDAVFLGVGCQKGTTMGLAGEDDPRCCDGIELLRRIGNDEDVQLPGRVVVVGGGNVAMDVVRSALRLGAESVKLVYRRTRAEMPADSHEIHDAIEEGVEMHFLTNPTRILPGADALEIECVKRELGEPDDSGRRRPVVIEGSEFLMEADWFVAAIGQASDLPETLGVETNRWNEIVTEAGQTTSTDGVFTGGDIHHGPASVIKAINAGRLAAVEMDQYLGGDGVVEQVFIEEEPAVEHLGRISGFGCKSRCEVSMVDPEERIRDFSLAELGFDEAEARKEAERCLQCQLRLLIPSAPEPGE